MAKITVRLKEGGPLDYSFGGVKYARGSVRTVTDPSEIVKLRSNPLFEVIDLDLPAEVSASADDEPRAKKKGKGKKDVEGPAESESEGAVEGESGASGPSKPAPEKLAEADLAGLSKAKLVALAEEMGIDIEVLRKSSASASGPLKDELIQAILEKQ